MPDTVLEMETGAPRCQGWRRYGGAFTVGGTLWWERCREEATVMLTVQQGAETKTLPGCQGCWQECIDNGIVVLSAAPIPTASTEVR